MYEHTTLCLSICQLMDIWVVFHRLANANSIAVGIYIQVFGVFFLYQFSFLLSMYHGVGLLNYTVILCLRVFFMFYNFKNIYILLIILL